MNHIRLTLGLVCFFSLSCWGAEVDNFSSIKRGVPNATSATNKIINGYLQKLSRDLKSCNVNQLLEAAKTVMDENFPEIINDLEKAGFHVEKDKVALYTGYKSPVFSGCCAVVLQFGKTKAGTDKIDHFLAGGYEYYMEYRKNLSKGAALAEKAAIELGFALEDSVWGLEGSGRKSYGDLAANYHGFQFYKQLFESEKPYLVCEKNRWIQKRQFDVAEYVDDSWDESINCTSYDNQSNRDLVFRNMKKIGFEKCPVDAGKCRELTAKYGKLGLSLLHPRCLDENSQHNQVEKKGSTSIKVTDFLSPNDYWKLMRGAQ